MNLSIWEQKLLLRDNRNPTEIKARQTDANKTFPKTQDQCQERQILSSVTQFN